MGVLPSTAVPVRRRDVLKAISGDSWMSCSQVDAQRQASVVARFILTGAEKDGEAQLEAKQFGDVLFTDDRLSGYRSIVHKTYFVLEYVVPVTTSYAPYTISNPDAANEWFATAVSRVIWKPCAFARSISRLHAERPMIVDSIWQK